MDIIPPNKQSTPSQAYQKPGSNTNSPPPSPLSQLPPITPDKPHRSENKRSLRGVLSTIGLFVSAFLIAILLNIFVIQSYQVDGQSMEPTLQDEDRLIVNKIPRTISRIDGHEYIPHRGDIIIFNQSGLPGFVGEKQLIKRVIGVPGEHVVINGATTVYNDSHPEGFNPDNSGVYHVAAGQSCGNADILLKADEIFVMGDNRGNSEDSRCFGPIKTNQVVAKLVLRILPLNKAKSF